MKKLLAAALLISPLPALAQEQSENDAVLGVVHSFMDGLAAKDAEAMTALVTEDSYLAFVQPAPDGDRTQSIPLVQASAGLVGVPGEIAEPLGEAAVLIEGPVAMVWAPFAFYMDGARTHCGVNVVSLMRIDGDWKIATITYSHLTDGCTQAPTL